MTDISKKNHNQLTKRILPLRYTSEIYLDSLALYKSGLTADFALSDSQRDQLWRHFLLRFKPASYRRYSIFRTGLQTQTADKNYFYVIYQRTARKR